MDRLTLRIYATALLGTPYRWGGADTIDGFDCSGLVLELLWSQGMWPKGEDANAAEIYRRYAKAGCEIVRAPANKIVFEPGMLAFYGANLADITHIAMVFDTGGTIIEAGGGNSKTVDRATAAAQNAFVRLRRLDHRSDFLVTLRPDRLPAP